MTDRMNPLKILFREGLPGEESSAYRKSLQTVLSVLNSDPTKTYKPGSLECSLHSLWSELTLEDLRRALTDKLGLYFSGIYFSKDPTMEQAYESGVMNAIYLILRELGELNFEYHLPTRLYLSSSTSIDVSEEPIRATRIDDPLSAIKAYLDKIRQIIHEKIVTIDEEGNLVLREYFQIAPDVAFSLVGTGDALLRIAKEELFPERKEDCLRLARTAYEASGLQGTRYVAGKLNNIERSS